MDHSSFGRGTPPPPVFLVLGTYDPRFVPVTCLVPSTSSDFQAIWEHPLLPESGQLTFLGLTGPYVHSVHDFTYSRAYMPSLFPSVITFRVPTDITNYENPLFERFRSTPYGRVAFGPVCTYSRAFMPSLLPSVAPLNPTVFTNAGIFLWCDPVILSLTEWHLIQPVLHMASVVDSLDQMWTIL